jgi:hypothetical protein
MSQQQPTQDLAAFVKATAGMKVENVQFTYDAETGKTIVVVNGKPIADVVSAYFSFYGGTPYISFVVATEPVLGELTESTSFCLACASINPAGEKSPAVLVKAGSGGLENAQRVEFATHFKP